MTTQLLINELIDKNLTIGSVESFTGGLFAATLVNYQVLVKHIKGRLWLIVTMSRAFT